MLERLPMPAYVREAPGKAPLYRLASGRWLYPVLKRGFDLAATIALAPVAGVLVGSLALAVRLDGGNAFYGQRRVGKDGKAFTMWKLRTMVPDAEACLERHLECDPAARAEWTSTQKLKCDPRITRLGWHLRKYSADELPQLWNVFLGQMSLVGPRPFCVDQRRLYPGSAYFDMLPGMTGLWQTSERNECSFAERAVYDTRYAEIRSFMTDLRILLRTAAVVLRGTGL